MEGDHAAPRVPDDARERLLDAFATLLAGRSPEDPVVGAAEPLVATLRGWRDPAPLDDWLTAAEATPDVLAFAVGDAVEDGSGDEASGENAGEDGGPTAYLRHRDGAWTVVERDAFGPTAPTVASRARVEALVDGTSVRVDVVDALPVRVRSRFVGVG